MIIKANDTVKNKTAISKVDYYLTPDFAVGMFNSCKDVQMPSSNTPALSVLCGTTADKCTPQGWLNFMGSTSNGQTPFDIDFYLISDHKHLKSKHWQLAFDILIIHIDFTLNFILLISFLYIYLLYMIIKLIII